MRLAEHATVTLELSGARAQFMRFVNNRAAAGDWSEIDPGTIPLDEDGAGDAVSLVPNPNIAGSGTMGLEMPRPTTAGAIAPSKKGS